MAGKFSKSITTAEVLARLQSGEQLHMVDVRENDEWQSGHIQTAKHIPLGSITERHTELNKQAETIVICRSGNRSGLACELLEELGYNVVNMTGGMNAWEGSLSYH